MSEIFDIYQESLNDCLTKLNNILKVINNLSKDKTESAIKEANTLLSEASSILKRMEIESTSIKNNEKLAFKVKSFKSDLDEVSKRLSETQSLYINAKSKEAIYLNSDDNDEEMRNKNLIENEHAAEENNSKLEYGKRMILEIEAGGNRVLNELNSQTISMKKIAGNLDIENDLLEKSNSLVMRMLRRENRNKLYIVICILVIFLLSVAVFLIKTT